MLWLAAGCVALGLLPSQFIAVIDPVTRQLDFDDASLAENSRGSYPIDFIPNHEPSGNGGHPTNIVFLTADAYGVMPPIARLTPEQAMYHFISGYTSKIAGTEVGLGKEPELTFSTCFGAPFMVHPPHFYAELLKNKIKRHGVHCWLVNTGWIGGAYGIGKRISIKHTRALLNAALDGSLLKVQFRRDPVFGFDVPLSCEDVPSNILNPADAWPSKEQHADKYRQLAARFVENFKKFEEGCAPEVIAAGPKI